MIQIVLVLYRRCEPLSWMCQRGNIVRHCRSPSEFAVLLLKSDLVECLRLFSSLPNQNKNHLQFYKQYGALCVIVDLLRDYSNNFGLLDKLLEIFLRLHKKEARAGQAQPPLSQSKSPVRAWSVWRIFITIPLFVGVSYSKSAFESHGKTFFWSLLMMSN